MPIENRNLAAGARLVGRYKKEAYVCSVVVGEKEGELAYVLEGVGKRFTSLSAAASHLMAGAAVNGWRFWSVDGEAGATATPEAPTVADTAAKPKRGGRKPKGAAGKLFSRFPDQSKTAAGKTKWFCAACMKAFTVEGDAEPEACPEGHRADNPRFSGEPSETASEPVEAAAVEVAE